MPPLFDRSELIRCSEGTLFGESTPKLPSPPLLAFDEIIEIGIDGGKFGRGYAIARKRLSSMNWVFDSHFPEDPVMPGTMLIEGLLQLAGFFGAYVGERGKGRAARVDEVKFLAESHRRMKKFCIGSMSASTTQIRNYCSPKAA
jgi:3-hydroxyacyl-[acyl-carrier protein] dehydratase / trans-2-decenoyl-[acyl-carrier protein] isomerase